MNRKEIIARALCKQHATACGVNELDAWNIHCEDFYLDAERVETALNNTAQHSRLYDVAMAICLRQAEQAQVPPISLWIPFFENFFEDAEAVISAVDNASNIS